ELADTGGDEIGAELVIAAEIAVDGFLQLGRKALAAATLLHPFPEMYVVVMLAGIVEEARILTVGFLDDLFERLAFHAGFGRQLIAVVDIGLVVLVVVIFQRLLRHIGLKGLVVVR